MRYRDDGRSRLVDASKPSLSTWLSRGPGALLLEEEMHLASQLVANLFGYHLVLVGGPEYAPVLGASRILHASIVVPAQIASAAAPAETGPATLVASPDSLPLNSDCVDVVLLPHVLEFTPNPHDALREAERVLVGEGHLILMGFNPRGAMGLWRVCLRQGRGAPWNGQFFSTTRIKDWLALLGFDVLVTQSAFFRPPFQNQKLLDRLGFLERVGTRTWPYLGATYAILARKRLTTLTPLRPRWRRPRRLVSVRIAEPSSRAGVREAMRGADGPAAVPIPADACDRQV